MDIDVASAVNTSATRVLLVADARSPTTWGWVDAIRSAGVVVLGRDGKPWPERRASANDESVRVGEPHRLRALASATPRRLKTAQKLRRTVGPMHASVEGHRLRRTVELADADAIHALRIPYEAMTALAARPRGVPLAVSIWGNDLTLHASTNWLVGQATRRVLASADLLFADCQRDINLAGRWGFRPGFPTAVLPGGGGVQLEQLDGSRWKPESPLADVLESGQRLIVNARGCREYVLNDILLDALSILATDLDPSIRVVFIDAVHDRTLRRSIEGHPLASRIIVTRKLLPSELLSLLCHTEIYVSITTHDGTPNSLLESMAAGAIPVCGDIPSIREWIGNEVNGFLANVSNSTAIAHSLRSALEVSDQERCAIKAKNARIIAARAERGASGRQAAEKYHKLVRDMKHLALLDYPRLIRC
jgi:glycosyltransferase involved in cell wall biosynthesis